MNVLLILCCIESGLRHDRLDALFHTISYAKVEAYARTWTPPYIPSNVARWNLQWIAEMKIYDRAMKIFRYSVEMLYV